MTYNTNFLPANKKTELTGGQITEPAIWDHFGGFQFWKQTEYQTVGYIVSWFYCMSYRVSRF